MTCWTCDENKTLFEFGKIVNDFWQTKFKATVMRDLRSAALLRGLGWHVVTVWECETKNRDGLLRVLAKIPKVGSRLLVVSRED